MSTLSQEYKPDFILYLYTVNIFYLGVQYFAEIDFSTYQQGIELTCFFFYMDVSLYIYAWYLAMYMIWHKLLPAKDLY